MTTTEAATKLGLARRWVRKLCETGRLKAVQLGGRGDWDIRPEDLAALVRRPYRKTKEAK